MLRHRSFSFQEFSQRYADPTEDLEWHFRDARLQDPKNRQASIEVDDADLKLQWLQKQAEVANASKESYAWALENGIADELLNTVMDPNVVKFIDDYRRLKNGITKGAAKRKEVPTKKVPTKKPAAVNKKAADKEKMVKARAFKEGVSKDDQMDFLRQYASNSLNK